MIVIGFAKLGDGVKVQSLQFYDGEKRRRWPDVLEMGERGRI
jgi:hypothetical protein